MKFLMFDEIETNETNVIALDIDGAGSEVHKSVRIVELKP